MRNLALTICGLCHFLYIRLPYRFMLRATAKTAFAGVSRLFMRIVTLSGAVHTLIYDFLCGLLSVVSKCECFQSKNISALLYVITIFAMSKKV